MLEVPLSAISSLEGSYVGLCEVLSKREKLVEQFKVIKENEVQYYYFGLTLPTGHTNQEYSDVIEAIHSPASESIFLDKTSIYY